MSHVRGPGILLDVYSALFPAGGIGRYVRDVARGLIDRPDAPPAAFVYPARLPTARMPDWPADRLRPLPIGWRRARFMLLASARLGLRPDAFYGDPVLVHSPAGYGPLFRRAKLLLTVHDLTFLHHPEWHPARTAWLWNQTMPFAIRHADRVLCDSEFVRRQVIALPGVDATRIETMHLAVDPHFRPLPEGEAAAHVARRFGLDGPFVLHVGTLEPRKNHVGLIGAFERLRRAGFPGRLVLVGQDGWRMEGIGRRLETSPDAGAILRVRDADDRDLLALYGACTAFAFPSFDEGFGLPPIEAMACGAACVTSDASSLREIAEGAAWLVDPASEEGLADALIALWREPDRRADFGARGIERAGRFGRDAFFARLFGVYRELSGGRGATSAAPRAAAAW